MNSFTFGNVYRGILGIAKKSFLSSTITSVVVAIILALIVVVMTFLASIAVTIIGTVMTVLIGFVYIHLLSKISLNAAFDKPVFHSLFLSGKQWLHLFLYAIISIVALFIPYLVMLLGLGIGLALNPFVGMFLLLVGVILFLIAGFFLYVKYAFVGHSILEKNYGVMDAFAESARITKGNRLMISCINLLMFVFLFIIGGIVYSIVIIFFGYSALDTLASIVPKINSTSDIVLSVIEYGLNYFVFLLVIFVTSSMYKVLDDKGNSKVSNKSENLQTSTSK